MGENPHSLRWVPLFMLAAQTILEGSFVLLYHTCWLLFTYPADALALESFLQYAGEGGREGTTKCQRKPVLKVLVLYNRMFSSRCLSVLIY